MWILLVFRSHTRRSLRGIPHLSFQIFILYLCEKVRQKTRTIIYYNLFVNLTDSKMLFWQKTYLQSLLLNSGLIGLRSGIQGNCRLHLICRHYEPLSRFIIKTMSQIFQQISSILNFFWSIMVYGFRMPTTLIVNKN